MGLEDYIVAIPSYKRPETLKTKTLKVLQDYKIKSAIDVGCGTGWFINSLGYHENI